MYLCANYVKCDPTLPNLPGALEKQEELLLLGKFPDIRKLKFLEPLAEQSAYKPNEGLHYQSALCFAP